jgi:hypothetical protein
MSTLIINADCQHRLIDCGRVKAKSEALESADTRRSRIGSRPGCFGHSSPLPMRAGGSVVKRNKLPPAFIFAKPCGFAWP